MIALFSSTLLTTVGCYTWKSSIKYIELFTQHLHAAQLYIYHKLRVADQTLSLYHIEFSSLKKKNKSSCSL